MLLKKRVAFGYKKSWSIATITKATKGLNYDKCIEGLLRNQVANKIATRAIKNAE